MTTGSNPGAAEELNARGNELAGAKQYVEAEAAYRRALEADASLAKVHGNLGTVLAHQGRFEEAVATFRRGLELGGSPKLAAKLASLLIELGRAEELAALAASAAPEIAVALTAPLAKHHESRGSVLRAGAAWLALREAAPEAAAAELSRLTLEVELAAGGTIVVPSALDLITPYVLLEQRDWFEDEIHFVRRLLREGEGAVDVGANFGVYTLAMARAVGARGRVVAYEPASATFAFLQETLRKSGLSQVEAVCAAISSREGFAEFSNASSPELSGLSATSHAPGVWRERVRLETLDAATARLAGRPVGLLKLDAEGEEVNILASGARFVEEHDPLIMAELRHGPGVNEPLLARLGELGLSLFVLLPGPGALVALDEAAIREPFVLNVFACSPRRAALLRERGLLGDAAEGQLGASEIQAARDRLRSVSAAATPAHLAAAALFVAASGADRVEDRLAGLHGAQAAARELIQHETTAAAWSLLARVAAELGRRAEANEHAARALAALRDRALGTPLVAPLASYDALLAAAPTRRTLEAALLELLLRRKRYSTFYDRALTSLARELVDLGDPHGHGARVLEVARRAGR